MVGKKKQNEKQGEGFFPKKKFISYNLVDRKTTQ